MLNELIEQIGTRYTHFYQDLGMTMQIGLMPTRDL